MLCDFSQYRKCIISLITKRGVRGFVYRVPLYRNSINIRGCIDSYTIVTHIRNSNLNTDILIHTCFAIDKLTTIKIPKEANYSVLYDAIKLLQLVFFTTLIATANLFKVA